jgi:hypothetical protein
MRLDPAIGWIIALSLGLLLGAAAVHKLRDPGRFRSIVAGYRLLPRALEWTAALVVIAVELLAAGLLVLPSRRTLGAALAAALLAGYAIALAVNLGRGRTRIDCGCLGFGHADRIAWWMVGRNLALVALALVTALPASTRDLVALDGLTVAGSVVAAAVLYSAAARLAATPPIQGGAS